MKLKTLKPEKQKLQQDAVRDNIDDPKTLTPNSILDAVYNSLKEGGKFIKLKQAFTLLLF